MREGSPGTDATRAGADAGEDVTWRSRAGYAGTAGVVACSGRHATPPLPAGRPDRPVRGARRGGGHGVGSAAREGCGGGPRRARPGDRPGGDPGVLRRLPGSGAPRDPGPPHHPRGGLRLRSGRGRRRGGARDRARRHLRLPRGPGAPGRGPAGPPGAARAGGGVERVPARRAPPPLAAHPLRAPQLRLRDEPDAGAHLPRRDRRGRAAQRARARRDRRAPLRRARAPRRAAGVPLVPRRGGGAHPPRHGRGRAARRAGDGRALRRRARTRGSRGPRRRAPPSPRSPPRTRGTRPRPP